MLVFSRFRVFRVFTFSSFSRFRVFKSFRHVTLSTRFTKRCQLFPRRTWASQPLEEPFGHFGLPRGSVRRCRGLLGPSAACAGLAGPAKPSPALTWPVWPCPSCPALPYSALPCPGLPYAFICCPGLSGPYCALRQLPSTVFFNFLHLCQPSSCFPVFFWFTSFP